MSNFQIIVTGIFVCFIIVGVVVFAAFKGKGTNELPQIVLWGTVDETLFTQYLNAVNADLPVQLKITYVQKRDETFHEDLVEAIATGKGPDAVILPQELILKEFDKLAVIPPSVISERDFKDTYIQEAELYLTAGGTIALPFSVDPIVMYWNRDILGAAGYANYPKVWDEISELSKKVTVRDPAANISRAAVAFGEFRNVTHAKELLSTLFMQAGTPIVGVDRQRGIASVLDQSFGFSPKPAEAALAFYTQFSDPAKSTYSWNRAMAQSKNLFISGDLAIYFGYASELPDIRAKNPQLNFDVGPIPQAKSVSQKTTFGRILGFAFPKSSPNVNSAYTTLTTLVTPAALVHWTELTYLPPVRRDMLAALPTDPYLSTFYQSALIARGWLDPAAAETNEIFGSMVENVVSGREKIPEAVNRGSNQIDNLIPHD